jgi:uncharacterized protein YdeI (YjbR/CyaY-like superfamily)
MFDSGPAAIEADMDPTFFETPADFRAWLAENHAEAGFLWVGFYKKGSGRRSITWPESVDEALCYGWIDGVRKGIDAESSPLGGIILYTYDALRGSSRWRRV